jgi:TRAP-type C4-dicarboxylate transport system permease small subunit
MDLVLGIPLWWAYVFFVLAMGVSALRYLIAVGLWLEVWRGGLNPEAFQKKTLL